MWYDIPMSAWIGPLIVVLAVTFYATLPPLLKKVSQNGIPPFTMMTVSMFTLFLSSFIASFLFEKGLRLKPVLADKNLFFILVAVGLINTVGFWLAIQGYKYMPLWQQTMFTLLTPVLAGIFAYFVLGEAISLKLFLGLVIMGLGLFIAVR